MRLQVLANDTLHLQCAKLKVREVSGGRNRAGAGLVSRAQHFPPPPARGALCLLPPPSTHLSLCLSHSVWSLNHFAKNLPLFLRRFQLLMFVNKRCACRVLISSWILLCVAVWLSYSSPNPPETEHYSWHRLGVKWRKISEKFDDFPKKLGVILLQSEICCVGANKGS